MTIAEFSTLSENGKAQAAWRGEFITTGDYKNYAVMLYRVTNFYGEVLYYKVDCRPVRFHAITSLTRLAVYFGPCLN